MNFSNPFIDVGEVPENTTVRVVFNMLPNIPGITRVVPGCEKCTSYKIVGDKLHVGINLKGIPKHLSNLDGQLFRKVVTVQYDNKTLDVLHIHGKKIKK